MSSMSDEKWNRLSLPITLTLQKVKMKLMSRQVEQQEEAVAWLVNELNVNSRDVQDLLILALLKSEIIALLCDTTLTMSHGHLVISTLKCLASLTANEHFYRQNHASYVIASILRTGHFLTFDSNLTKDQLAMLESIAYTLEKIFEGAETYQIAVNEICELSQTYEFFKKLLTSETQAYRIIFSIAKILTFILRYTKVNEKIDEEIVFAVVQTVLKLMRKILDAKNPADGKYAFRAMVMTCAVCAAGIQLCEINNDRETDDIGLLKSSANNRDNFANCVYSSMMKAVIPNFNRIDQDERNGQFYLWFVTCLNGLYDLNDSRLKDLSNYLADQGFLQTLPRLTILPTQNLRNETLLLISRILTTLASVSLSIETWLGGAKQFGKFLINAFKSLPPDPSSWLILLGDGDARADALLVLFYFNLLVDSMSNAALYLPLIITYLLSSTNLKPRRKSITVQKALWFTFSIAAVSHDDPSSVESYEVATTCLFNDLESVDVKQCYTHHPAVIVHCLKSTSFVSEKLRANVVCLWLENGGDVGSIVDSTPKNDLTNYYCLLEMVRTGSPQTVDVAMKAISELVKNPETVESLGFIAWEILQQVLESGYERNDYNTTSVLKLAGAFEPDQISGTLLVRLLYRLTSFILENENDKELVSLGIKNAYCLLSLSIRRNDIRGVTMFTSKPSLIKVLKNLALAKNDPGLSYICFNCLSALIRYQENYSVQCENTVEIESEELLEQLYLEECFGVLRLFAVIFASKIERPVIALKNLFSGSDYDVPIRGIYLQLHSIHTKSGSEGRSLCCASLAGILDHCATLGNIKILKSLCEMDWTYVLIEVTIGGGQNLHPHFMDFASEWLFHRYSLATISHAYSGDRVFPRDQFETALELLGKAAVRMFKERLELESLQRLVQSLMLFQEHFSDNTGSELEEVDRQLAKN